MRFNFLLFEDFEALDLFGPLEVLSQTEGFEPFFLSVTGGLIISRQGAKIATEPLTSFVPNEVLIVPGGQGTRKLVNDFQFLGFLRELAEKSSWVLTVSTGAALLAKTGLLDGLAATSNKRAWPFALLSGPKVNWKKNARWTVAGKYYASSGISAGIDMTLGFVADRFNYPEAQKIAIVLEYLWREDRDNDPFAVS
ncbi:MAG: DJ-1/PfpI family protein [Deltaproteobacteria bacterium]|jgi:putative intracellular protease/amidase|nr:DJ-1/PfpI family protein [Deltaproteobacteria bacterium]